jgi:hypothetical protein
MKEPQRIKLNPETPTNKDVKRIPMPHITGQDNDDIYTTIELDSSNKPLDKINEDNPKNN